MYGDSYGSVRRPGASPCTTRPGARVVLDGTYDHSFDPLEPEESVSLRHAWRALCRRSGACHGHPALDRRLRPALRAHPLVGRGLDADGFAERVLPGDARRSSPSSSRTRPSATRSSATCPARCAALRDGDRAPMLRLAAEDVSFDAAGGGAAGYSVGDFAAVSCHDYPTVWDVSASPAQRRAPARPRDRAAPARRVRAVLEAGVARVAGRGPARVRLPRAGRRRRVSDPAFPARPAPAHPRARARRRVRPGDAGRRRPPRGRRLAGLDLRARCATPPTSAPWPTSRAARAASCAGSCARLAAGDTSLRPAGCRRSRWPASRRALAAAPAAHALARRPVDRAPRRRAAWVAAATVGDAYARWYNLMFGTVGHGLRGGRYTIAGRYYSLPPAADPVRAATGSSPIWRCPGTATWNAHGATAAGDARRCAGPAAASRPDRARLPDRPAAAVARS